RRGRADSPRALRPPSALPEGPLREARRARAISGQGGPGRGPPHRPVTRALEGVTVLSLEQATVLPFLTYRLACDGARVIRVENAERPDPNRFVGRDVLGEADMRSYFLPNNCGKEAVTLNLGEAEGRRILRELVRALRVDVFATNQRPRSYAKLGIDDATLLAVQPDLTWLDFNVFGPATITCTSPSATTRSGPRWRSSARSPGSTGPSGPRTPGASPMWGGSIGSWASASRGSRPPRRRPSCARRGSRSRGSTRWPMWSPTRWWLLGSSTSGTRAPASPSRCPRLRSATRRRSLSRRVSASTTTRSTARRSGTRRSGSSISGASGSSEGDARERRLLPDRGPAADP